MGPGIPELWVGFAERRVLHCVVVVACLQLDDDDDDDDDDNDDDDDDDDDEPEKIVTIVVAVLRLPLPEFSMSFLLFNVKYLNVMWFLFMN